MLANSELTEHEDYCGSRTEPCETCGRYIMVRDVEIHQQTNCEYPPVEQKNRTESSADAAAGFNYIGDNDFNSHVGGLFGRSMLHPDLPDHVREMLENQRCDLPFLEGMFGRMGIHGRRPVNPLFGDRFRPSFGDPPPPYHSDNNADDARANDGHASVEEQNIHTDNTTVGSDDDDDGKSTSVHFGNIFLNICKCCYLLYVRDL